MGIDWSGLAPKILVECNGLPNKVYSTKWLENVSLSEQKLIRTTTNVYKWYIYNIIKCHVIHWIKVASFRIV